MDFRLIRSPGRISKDGDYLVSFVIGWDIDSPELGFAQITAQFIIPADIGDKMTYDGLMAEAYRRFDSMKHLL